MKKKFEMPIVDIRTFELENVVTSSSGGAPDTQLSASEKATKDLNDMNVTSIFNFIF